MKPPAFLSFVLLPFYTPNSLLPNHYKPLQQQISETSMVAAATISFSHYSIFVFGRRIIRVPQGMRKGSLRRFAPLHIPCSTRL
jgi:hypothetical protein